MDIFDFGIIDGKIEDLGEAFNEAATRASRDPAMDRMLENLSDRVVDLLKELADEHDVTLTNAREKMPEVMAAARGRMDDMLREEIQIIQGVTREQSEEYARGLNAGMRALNQEIRNM